MPGRLTLGPLLVSRGERVILRERRDSDIEDRLRDPTAPGEDDHYGSSWRREWDGRRYHPREHLAAGHGPAEPGSHRWAVEHEGHCIGSAGLRVDARQEGIRRHYFMLMAVLQPEKRIRSLGHPPSGPDRA